MGESGVEHRVTKTMVTETGHRLVDYEGKCAHLHGHSYFWEVTAKAVGGLTFNGMVCDFKDLKRAMKGVLDPLDHAMVLYRHRDPLWVLAVKLSQYPTKPHCIENYAAETVLKASDNRRGRIIWVDFNPTAENLATYVLNRLQDDISIQYGGSVVIEKVKVWETQTSYAEVFA